MLAAQTHTCLGIEVHKRTQNAETYCGLFGDRWWTRNRNSYHWKDVTCKTCLKYKNNPSMQMAHLKSYRVRKGIS